jgi:hypothetical protein
MVRSLSKLAGLVEVPTRAGRDACVLATLLADLAAVSGSANVTLRDAAMTRQGLFALTQDGAYRMDTVIGCWATLMLRKGSARRHGSISGA